MNHNTSKLLILVILLLAILARLPLLTGSFWLDEAAQAFESTRSFSQQLHVREDFQPPLLHLIVHIASYSGQEEWWLRSIGALIPGIVTIWLVYLLAKEQKLQSVGIIASLLLSTASFHIFYSQELRPYSLPTLWAVLSWWLVLKMKSESQAAQQHQKWWVVDKVGGWWIVVSLAGLYSSYLYPFLLLGQVCYLLIARIKQFRQVLLLGTWICLGFLPWLPFFLEQLMVGQGVRDALPNWDTVVSTSQLKVFSLLIGKFIFGVLDLELGWQFLLPTMIVFGLLALLSWQARKQPFKKWLIWCCWLVIPVVTAWLVSFVIPVLQPKRVLYALPGFYLLVSWLVLAGWQSRQRFWQGVSVVTLLCFLSINIFSTYKYYTRPELQRENWRALVAEIHSIVPADQTVIVFAFPYPFPSWEWYNRYRLPSISTGQLYINQETELSLALSNLEKYDVVILPDYLRDLTDPSRQLEAYLHTQGFTEVKGVSYPLIGTTRILVRGENSNLLK